jgi:hypothetical protein
MEKAVTEEKFLGMLGDEVCCLTTRTGGCMLLLRPFEPSGGGLRTSGLAALLLV